MPEEATVLTADEALKLVFWKLRHENPNPAIRFSEQEREAFAKSLAYNEQTPVINFEVRGSGPQRVQIVHLTDTKGDQIVFTESDERDAQIADRMRERQVVAAEAPDLAGQLRSMLARGEIADSLIQQAAHALDVLARK